MVAFGDFSDSDVTVELDNYIALVEFHRPPHNYFDVQEEKFFLLPESFL